MYGRNVSLLYSYIQYKWQISEICKTIVKSLAPPLATLLHVWSKVWWIISAVLYPSTLFSPLLVMPILRRSFFVRPFRFSTSSSVKYPSDSNSSLYSSSFRLFNHCGTLFYHNTQQLYIIHIQHSFNNKLRLH